MYLLSVNLYELGQFLQILLWISLPVVIVALLVATYLHYRTKRRELRIPHSPEDGIPDKLRSSNDRLASSLFVGDPTAALPEESGNAYRGLLWMKDKYEQYREQTDRKIEKLKEELTRSEEKYFNLQAARIPLSQAPAIVQESNAAPQLDIFPQPAIVQQASSMEIPDDTPSKDSTSSPAIALTGEAAPTEVPPTEAAGLPALSIAEEQDLRIEGLQLELEQRIRDYHQLQYQYRDEQTQASQLSEQYAQAQELVRTRQFEIEELNTRLLQQQHKLTDLTFKLECNT